MTAVWKFRAQLTDMGPLGHARLHETVWFEEYCVFWTIRCTFFPQIWEVNGGASYSLNVAYLARCVEGGLVVEQGFFSYFPPLKPRCVIWSEKYGICSMDLTEKPL